MRGTQGFKSANTRSTIFTIAVLPDVQRELWNLSDIENKYKGRLRWLAQNKTALNLKYVLCAGDVHDTDNLIFSSDKSVNPRYIPGWPIDHFQYYHASESFKILDNAGVPYMLSLGNHDTGCVCGGPACPVVAGQTDTVPVELRNTSTWNTFYPPDRFPGMVTCEVGKSDNSYRTFIVGALKWLVLSLESWPRAEMVTWAKSVLAAHPHHNVIILEHSYIDGSGNIIQTAEYGANSAQYVYDHLVKVYPNVKFVFSGHVDSSALRTDTGINGNKIYAALSCYHDTTNNWIRLLTFDVAQKTVKSRVYAPLTNASRSDAADTFTLPNVEWVR